MFRHATVLRERFHLKRFHLKGHTIGFSPQTQKIEIHFMSPYLTLVVNGFKPEHDRLDHYILQHIQQVFTYL